MKQEIDIMAKFASRIMAMGTTTVVIALLLSAVLQSCVIHIHTFPRQDDVSRMELEALPNE